MHLTQTLEGFPLRMGQLSSSQHSRGSIKSQPHALLVTFQKTDRRDYKVSRREMSKKYQEKKQRRILNHIKSVRSTSGNTWTHWEREQQRGLKTRTHKSNVAQSPMVSSLGMLNYRPNIKIAIKYLRTQ
jgi:hypothetical protein